MAIKKVFLISHHKQITKRLMTVATIIGANTCDRYSAKCFRTSSVLLFMVVFSTHVETEAQRGTDKPKSRYMTELGSSLISV